jgi:elongation of very long chain fatty acids protein 1
MEVFIIVINSSVHIIMYAFYFCSSVKSLAGPAKVVKPFLTSIQLIQLTMILIQCFAALSPSCGASKIFYLQSLNMFILISLFAKFFIQSYLKPKKVHKK